MIQRAATFLAVLAAVGVTLPFVRCVPNEIGVWAIAAIAGGLIGSELGIKHWEKPR
jgi:hypothetical protein